MTFSDCCQLHYCTVLRREAVCFNFQCSSIQGAERGCTVCKNEAWPCKKPVISTRKVELFTAAFWRHAVQLAIHHISSTEELEIEECSDLIVKKIPKRRRKRRRDITVHEIQYGHKPLSQKCNLPISFAYLLIHLLLIWWNWGVVRVMWCKGFILQNNLWPTVLSLQFQITEIRKEAFKKEALILYSLSAWFSSGIASTIFIRTQTFKHMPYAAKSGWVSMFQVL